MDAPSHDHDLRGHLDGFALTYLGAELEVFPNFIGAAMGLRNARLALTLLNQTLAKAGQSKGANHG